LLGALRTPMVTGGSEATLLSRLPGPGQQVIDFGGEWYLMTPIGEALQRRLVRRSEADPSSAGSVQAPAIADGPTKTLEYA
jgi:hypothetical protein